MFYQITDCQMPCKINLVFLISTMIKDEIVSDPHLPNIDFFSFTKKKIINYYIFAGISKLIE